MTNPLKFIVGDRAMTLAEIEASAPKIKRPPADRSTQFHEGFRVEGPPPGALEEAETSAKRELADWDAAANRGHAFGKRPKEEMRQIAASLGYGI